MVYSNHATVDLEPKKTLKTLVKDHTRANVLLMDERLIHYISNTHKSPIGLTDMHHPIKKPRLFFDATFRPKIWS